jgi:hypothetical protein
MRRSFSDMPDDARLWVFAAPRALDESQESWLHDHVASFVDEWVAHGAPVVGSYDLREGRFLLVSADEAATGVSGCSIDALTRTLKQAERELGISLLDAASQVWYRDGSGKVVAVPRAGFRERITAGEVGDDTHVFDNTAATVGAVRNGAWERPMRESWHGKAFGQQAKL